MQFSDSIESANLVERRPGKNNQFEDNTPVFYENNRREIPTQHNRPLYITVKVQHVKLRRVLLGASSSLNIISLDVLDDIRVSREKIQKQPFVVSSFNEIRTYRIGSMSLDLTIGPTRTAHRFHVIDSQTSYHLLLGRPWVHRYKAIPSPTISAYKRSGKGGKFISTPRDCPFKEMKRISPRSRRRRSYYSAASRSPLACMGRPRGKWN